VSSRRTTEDERAETNPLQFYRTPPWATWALLSKTGGAFRGAGVLELGAGDGCIAREVLSSPFAPRFYAAVELDEGRGRVCHERIGPMGGHVMHGDVLTMQLGFQPDVVVMNPPFDNAHMFLLAAARFVRPGGFIYMLQRCTYPGSFKTDRDLLFKHDNPIGAALGYFGEISLTNRLDFRGDGACDSVNHSWFGFSPGSSFPDDFTPTRTWLRKESCPWDPSRDPEVSRQQWQDDDRQLPLL
jgi:hypothetical protein